MFSEITSRQFGEVDINVIDEAFDALYGMLKTTNTEEDGSMEPQAQGQEVDQRMVALKKRKRRSTSATSSKSSSSVTRGGAASNSDDSYRPEEEDEEEDIGDFVDDVEEEEDEEETFTDEQEQFDPNNNTKRSPQKKSAQKKSKTAKKDKQKRKRDGGQSISRKMFEESEVTYKDAIQELLPRGIKEYMIRISKEKQACGVCACGGCVAHEKDGWLWRLALTAYFKGQHGPIIRSHVMAALNAIDQVCEGESTNWCTRSLQVAMAARKILALSITKKGGYQPANATKLKSIAIGIVRSELGYRLTQCGVFTPPDPNHLEATRNIFVRLESRLREDRKKFRKKTFLVFLNDNFTALSEVIDPLTWKELNNGVSALGQHGCLTHIIGVRGLFEGRCLADSKLIPDLDTIVGLTY